MFRLPLTAAQSLMQRCQGDEPAPHHDVVVGPRLGVFVVGAFAQHEGEGRPVPGQVGQLQLLDVLLASVDVILQQGPECVPGPMAAKKVRNDGPDDLLRDRAPSLATLSLVQLLRDRAASGRKPRSSGCRVSRPNMTREPCDGESCRP